MLQFTPTKKLIFGILCGICIFAFQNCGQGGMEALSNSQSASSIPVVTATSPRVISADRVLNTNSQMNFSVANLPAGAALNWSHKFNDTSLCSVNPSASQMQYSLTCSFTGILAVSVFVNAPKAPTFAQSGFFVNYVAPTPTPPPGPTPVPTPTPIPTPIPIPDPTALAEGRALYATHCESCHGPVQQSNERFTGYFGTNYAIDHNIGGMAIFSFLTHDQRVSIGLALSN